MQSLSEMLDERSRFLIATELVSVRGSMSEASAIKTRTLANELVACPEIDWVSITDNAGGHPQLSPLALGRPILYAGKEVVIHFTCKDQNRNGLESAAWMLNSEGFHNILAMTGDYPLSGAGGMAKPVFDIDSVGLIWLLSRMNQGLHRGTVNGSRRLGKTQFCIGAVTTNFKLHEGEVIPQYLKLQKKIECGAKFIISQIGFDARKTSELRCYMDSHGAQDTPLIGNVYLLSARAAQVFHEGRIPGVVVSEPLFELCRHQGQSLDQGQAFFIEFAAKQIAVCRGLGCRGVYLGGVHDLKSIERILAVEKSFGPGDWKQFAREIQFSRPGEFFYYEANPETALADPTRETMRTRTSSRHLTVVYGISKLAHNTVFEVGKPVANLGASLCAHARDPSRVRRRYERWS
jgi:methylenetetrahydrofolate reductase (NADPH)